MCFQTSFSYEIQLSTDLVVCFSMFSQEPRAVVLHNISRSFHNSGVTKSIGNDLCLDTFETRNTF